MFGFEGNKKTTPYEELDPEVEGKAVKVDPETEKAIEGEPVSDKVKRQRLAGEMIRTWEEKQKTEKGLRDVEILDDDDMAQAG